MKSRKKKILLIEDNVTLSDLVASLVDSGDQEFELSFARNLKNGMRHLADEARDAVILDLGLPDSRGLSTFARLHEEFPDLPVVVLTANSDPDLPAELLAAGADDFVQKGSLNADLLLRAIRNSLSRARGRRALLRNRRHLEHILDGISEFVFVTRADGTITRVNQKARRACPDPQRLLGSSIENYFAIGVLEAIRPLLANDPEAADSDIAIETEMTVADGTQIPVRIRATQLLDEEEQPEDIVFTVVDLTEQLLREVDLRIDANFDTMTRLGNRLLFEKTLQELTHRAQTEGQHFALILVDIDNLKPINDRYGHQAGDALIRSAATRLQSAVRSRDLVCRLGGDEFAVLITSGDGTRHAKRIAARIIKTLGEEVRLDPQQRVATSGCAGIAFSRDHADPDALFQAADRALYAAKQAGKSTFRTAPTAGETQAEQGPLPGG